MKILSTSTVVILNGPLGIGKSTLTEVLSESIELCVALDGDRLIALNPPPSDATEYLHSIISLLLEHHSRRGYRHFVINHLWRTHAELADLYARVSAVLGDAHTRCFLLILPLEENLKRIARRGECRAIDEAEFEAATVRAERLALSGVSPGLGEPLDVSAPPTNLVEIILEKLRCQ